MPGNATPAQRGQAVSIPGEPAIGRVEGSPQPRPAGGGQQPAETHGRVSPPKDLHPADDPAIGGQPVNLLEEVGLTQPEPFGIKAGIGDVLHPQQAATAIQPAEKLPFAPA